MTSNDREEFRLDNLPGEMLFCITSYCDPRSLVNVICTSKTLRSITVQILLMGFGYQEIIEEGSLFANWYSANAEDRKEIYPGNLLSNYIDLLMKEDEVEMDRINLINFSNIKDYSKISKFISKFQIPELIVNPKNYYWVKNEINSSLSSITRLSFGKELAVEDGNYFHSLLQRPFTVLNGICAKNAMDVKNITTNSQLCSGLKVLSLSLINSVVSYALKEILKNCRALRELNLFICGFSKDDYGLFAPFEVDDELMDIMCNSNLEILRLDTSFNFNLFSVKNLAEKKTYSVFPNLKIYSNHLQTPEFDSILMPNHPLQTVSLFIPVKNHIDIPKCQKFYGFSLESSTFPIVDTPKYIISRGTLDTFETYQNWIACTSLRELNLFNVETGSTKYDWKNIETSLEILNIQKSRVSVILINHIIDNSPNLKSINMQTVKVREVTGYSSLEFENQNVDSQLRSIHIANCNELYPTVFANILKKNLPHLQSVILENTYSIRQSTLISLFNKASSLSVFKVTGAEFNDELISKFFNSCSPTSLEYGVDFSFNGRNITSPFLLEHPYMSRVTTISLPDCTISNDDFIKILETLNPQLLKVQVNLGTTGPTIDTFKTLAKFQNLEMIYLSGKPEKPIQNLENFVLKEFVPSMPSLIILFMDCGEFIKEEIEHTKTAIRSEGKSAPKLILPPSKKGIVYKTEKDYNNSLLYSGSCSLQ